MEIKLEHVLLFLLFVLFLKMIRDKCGCNRVVEGARPRRRGSVPPPPTPDPDLVPRPRKRGSVPPPPTPDPDLVPTPPTPPTPPPAAPDKLDAVASAAVAALKGGPMVLLAANPTTAPAAKWYHTNVGATVDRDSSHVEHFFKNL